MNRSNRNQDRSEGLGGTYFKCVNANLDDETFNKMKKTSSKYLSQMYLLALSLAALVRAVLFSIDMIVNPFNQCQSS